MTRPTPRPRRVLIVEPGLQPPGGGQAVTAWMVQALKDDCDLTLAGWEPPDYAAVNRWYGTSIDGAGIAVKIVPARLRRGLDAVPLPLALLKWSVLLRWAKTLMHEYDLVISAANEADLGRPGIQYIHYPRRLRPRPKVDFRWYHRSASLLNVYYVLCDRLIKVSADRIAENVTLANSTWTADGMRRLYEANRPVVVHPPVSAHFPDVAWRDREHGFLCIGRFAPEKQLERVIEILAAVRRSVPGIHLHLVGGCDHRWYYRRIVRMARAHRDWVQVDEGLSRNALLDLIARHRYGIHGMQEEHFGIAPAEMVCGGCLVFVPNGGGQVDIVGAEDRLRYSGTQDAVAKIVRAVTDPAEQAALRQYLASRQPLFSVERFMTTIRDVAAQFGQPDASRGVAA